MGLAPPALWGAESHIVKLFGMAGLRDVSVKEDGTTIESCTVITVPGNRVMNGFEYPNGEGTGRRPAIFTREVHEAWLRGTPEGAFACLKPYAAN